MENTNNDFESVQVGDDVIVFYAKVPYFRKVVHVTAKLFIAGGYTFYKSSGKGYQNKSFCVHANDPQYANLAQRDSSSNTGTPWYYKNNR